MEDLKTISFTISRRQLTDVELLKERLDRDRSWVLRELIRRGLETVQTESTPAAPDMDAADRAVVEALARRIE